MRFKQFFLVVSASILFSLSALAATNSAIVIPNFTSPTACSEFIQNNPDIQSITTPFNIWAWFTTFATLGSGAQTNCVNGVCTFEYYYSPTGYPNAGGCTLVNTVFWQQTARGLMEQEAYNLANGEGSLPNQHFGIICTQRQPVNSNFSGCTLHTK